MPSSSCPRPRYENIVYLLRNEQVPVPAASSATVSRWVSVALAIRQVHVAFRDGSFTPQTVDIQIRAAVCGCNLLFDLLETPAFRGVEVQPQLVVAVDAWRTEVQNEHARRVRVGRIRDRVTTTRRVNATAEVTRKFFLSRSVADVVHATSEDR